MELHEACQVDRRADEDEVGLDGLDGAIAEVRPAEEEGSGRDPAALAQFVRHLFVDCIVYTLRKNPTYVGSYSRSAQPVVI